MALVQVPHRRRDAQLAQRPHAADPQDQLLAEPHLATAHVQDVGDGPIRPRVGGQVRVQQQDRDAADLRNPHRGMDLAVREVDADLQRRAVGGPRPAEWQHRGIQVRLRVLLVPIGIDLLAEVAAAVEEADADERQGRIGRGLAMVPGQDAQAAGVDLHRLVEAVFGAEVADGPGERAGWVGRDLLLIPGVAAVAHVAVVLIQQPAGVDQKLLVGRGHLPASGIHAGQHRDRIAVAGPRRRVEPREEGAGTGRPAPPQVVGEVVQALEPAWQVEVVARERRHAQRRARRAAHRGPILLDANISTGWFTLSDP